jgi:hypothetical protein
MSYFIKGEQVKVEGRREKWIKKIKLRKSLPSLCTVFTVPQIILSWRWRHQVSTKRWYLCSKVHSVTSQKFVILPYFMIGNNHEIFIINLRFQVCSPFHSFLLPFEMLMPLYKTTNCHSNPHVIDKTSEIFFINLGFQILAEFISNAEEKQQRRYWSFWTLKLILFKYKFRIKRPVLYLFSHM